MILIVSMLSISFETKRNWNAFPVKCISIHSRHIFGCSYWRTHTHTNRFFAGMHPLLSIVCTPIYFILSLVTFLHSSANYFVADFSLPPPFSFLSVVYFIFGGCFWSLTFNIQCIFHFRFIVHHQPSIRMWKKDGHILVHKSPHTHTYFAHIAPEWKTEKID